MNENIYYIPGTFDLEFVTSWNRPFLEYEFDMVAIWRKPDGSLWWAADSGCSCPNPFEDTRPEELEPLTLESFNDFKTTIRMRYSLDPVTGLSIYGDPDNPEVSMVGSLNEWLVKVHRILAP